jgi:hypothetical protein
MALLKAEMLSTVPVKILSDWVEHKQSEKKTKESFSPFCEFHMVARRAGFCVKSILFPQNITLTDIDMLQETECFLLTY